MGAVIVFTQSTSQKASADPVYKIHSQAALIADIDIIHIYASFNSKWTTTFYAQLNFSEMHFKPYQSLTLKETVTVT